METGDAFIEQIELAAALLLLLAVANIAPLVAKRMLGPRWAWPIDGGRKFIDGRPLLGASKTWRGAVSALVLCTLAAPVLGLSADAGALMALGAMAGDAGSSFVKRRLAIPPSGQAWGLDQVPEALVPLLLVQAVVDVPVSVAFGVTLMFLLLEPPLARLWHRLGWRDQPY
jgi:CDP-2,3-bis-(O-geranylgeranyl)-sn-glycerol synthase